MALRKIIEFPQRVAKLRLVESRVKAKYKGRCKLKWGNVIQLRPPEKQLAIKTFLKSVGR